jgi:hypothetical protein
VLLPLSAPALDELSAGALPHFCLRACNTAKEFGKIPDYHMLGKPDGDACREAHSLRSLQAAKQEATMSHAHANKHSRGLNIAPSSLQRLR